MASVANSIKLDIMLTGEEFKGGLPSLHENPNLYLTSDYKFNEEYYFSRF